MTDLDERLASALDDAVPHPPRELDPEAIRIGSAGRSRPGLLAPILAAAAMVVVAVTIAALVDRDSAPGRPFVHSGPARPVGPNGSTPSVHPVAHPARITARVVTRLLASAPTLPGATPVDHAPVEALRKPSSVWGSENLVIRTRWWTGPGSMTDAIAYFTAHPPADTKGSGSSTSGGPNGVTGESVSFEPDRPGWLRPTVYTGLEMVVEVVPAGDGIAIRVDVEAIWMPQRTAAEQIPGDVTSVDVVVDRGGSAPTVHKTLATADARALARIVNGLPVHSPGTFHCPMDRGWTDALTFRGPRSVTRVKARSGGCAWVDVGPRRDHNPSLSGGLTVDRAVLRALGLPRRYGQ